MKTLPTVQRHCNGHQHGGIQQHSAGIVAIHSDTLRPPPLQFSYLGIQPMKIVMLGKAGTGKTSMLIKFYNRNFNLETSASSTVRFLYNVLYEELYYEKKLFIVF